MKSNCLSLLIMLILIYEIDCKQLKPKRKHRRTHIHFKRSEKALQCPQVNFLEESDIKEKLQAKQNIFLEVWESGDLDGLTPVYTKDVIVLPQGLPTIYGFEALLDHYTQLRNSKEVARFDLQIEKAFQVSNTLAYSLDSGSIFNAEGELLESDIRGLEIWKKVKGDWRVDTLMINSGHNPMGQ